MSLRDRIELQIFQYSGLSLGTIDYEQPKGDPGLFGPDSVCWQLHSDFPSMLCGGISALLMQMLHPLALAGVWDHSNFREDLLGRLRRTSQFVAATTYAAKADAEAIIARVNRIHESVQGQAPDGRHYRAKDPELLTWVHSCEVYSFVRAYQTYRDASLSEAQIARYYTEMAQVAAALGATWVPRSSAEISDYFKTMQPALEFSARTQQVVDILFAAPAPSHLVRPIGQTLVTAGFELLPDWAKQQTGIRLPAYRKLASRAAMQQLVPAMRWAIRNGASARARRRVTPS